MSMKATPAERIARRAERGADGCLLWRGFRNAKGYGMLRINYRLVYAHRVAYEATVGPIPDGLTIDHLCNTPPCVNPEHMEPVTAGENSRRAHARRAEERAA